MCGLMSHGSNHPCTWCDVWKAERIDGSSGTLRTIGSLKQLYLDWCDGGALKLMLSILAMLYMNQCLTESMIYTLILDIIPPPELHLLIGPVTNMYNGLAKSWENTEEWAKMCKVERDRCIPWRCIYREQCCDTIEQH